MTGAYVRPGGGRPVARVVLRPHPAKAFVGGLSKESLIALRDGERWALDNARRALRSDELVFAARVYAAKILR